ncbi:MAG: TraB/GumN family protein [Treponema sp.]|nr:TraB/GumN family protein [Treponema sp.]
MSDTRLVIPLTNPQSGALLEFTLIGTAHVSRESISEVREIIQKETPGLVCVELDEGRYAAITRKDNWEKLNMVSVFKEGKGFLLMANLVLSGFQRRIGAELGVTPGEEMKTALDAAQELGIPYALCDREVQITLRRAWASCGLWNKCKLLASLLASAFTTEKLSAEEIEGLKKRNELDGMMSELSRYLPEIKQTLIDERDQYLAAKMWDSACKQAACQLAAGNAAAQSPLRVIAVVGAGHMQGIQAHLEKIAAERSGADHAREALQELDRIPSRRMISKALPFLIPLVIAALIVAGFLRGGADMGRFLLLQYLFWNGSLAALGAILALAHPLAILVAFVGAPITTMIPFIGVGIFSGIIQATLRKPRVQDAQAIIDDVGSLKGLYRNRMTRALLVFFLTNVGSSMGTFVFAFVSATAGRILGN